ncbi:hypothetical protein B5S28_g502 [[Candida] boidinii]|uniref:Unnamed protein product n=1 Tax=Candida boidinii TaxID=5477 RepID=A0ACB5TJP5_CANBO|nr:hypothetical protein B5S28_g502 [[Candida] boidinii]OWB59480.1 hypothetical protein B5S29_g338 [[Candida] boidinii]OWB71682.1 hypothetical protein B5S31_g1373 [[Candida] boidinii]OWB76411.1 hypothetical protein B5S32_g562 [[Candida] boidinii]GME89612.1 unnamed protein product [[Candida] boidinii]
MRPSRILFVKPRRASPPNSQPLLPPLVLYREILRAHRFLPKDQRILGDAYVKAEFKAHQNIDNPLHIVGFLTSWQDYLKLINKVNNQEELRSYTISSDQLSKMSDEQVGQLYELMKEAKNLNEPEDQKD